MIVTWQEPPPPPLYKRLGKHLSYSAIGLIVITTSLSLELLAGSRVVLAPPAALTPVTYLNPLIADKNVAKVAGARSKTSRQGSRANPNQPGGSLWQRLCYSRGQKGSLSGGTPWKPAKASTFYIGEEANASNAQISNVQTAWSDFALTDFGSGPDGWGPKDPDNWEGAWYKRNGWCPALGKNGVIKQNPFYVALPTPDHDSNGKLTEAEPWVAKAAEYLPELTKYPGGHFSDDQAPFKNLWVQIKYGTKVAYGQIQDVGPSDEQGVVAADYAYVWDPQVTDSKNSFGLKADIDLSPAITDYLSTGGNANVKFRIVPASQVPAGPWKVIVTTAGPHW